MAEISVIVPVYKCESYISRCIESILNQTFSDFELILVEDGSPDNSGQVCDDYAKIDSRIRVLHGENKGASSARNRGLNVATGNYVTFCDGDDAVSKKWLEHMVKYASDDTLPVTGHSSVFEALGMHRERPISADRTLGVNRYYSFSKCGLAGFLWNALYSKEIIDSHNIRLREQCELGDFNEDLLFNLQYVSHIKNVVYTGYADYFYDQHLDSLSRSNNRIYFLKYAEKYRLWLEFISTHGNDQEDIEHLSTTMLYHFLVSMKIAVEEGYGYSKFRNVVESDEMRSALTWADTTKESPRIIALLKQNKVKTLYAIYTLQNIKRRCKK